MKKPRGFLKHINLGLRGAGNSDGRKDLGKRLGDHQAELALLQASKFIRIPTVRTYSLKSKSWVPRAPEAAVLNAAQSGLYWMDVGGEGGR